jgi:hypothetical protein
MKHALGIAAVVLVSFVFAGGCASHPSGTTPSTGGVRSVSFAIANDLLVMPITTNRAELSGIVDTGSPVSLFPARAVDPQESRSLGHGSINFVLNDTADVPVEFLILESVEWAGYSFPDVVVGIVEDSVWDSLLPSEYVVIGTNLLVRGCPTFRFETQEVTLNRSDVGADPLIDRSFDLSALAFDGVALVDGHPVNVEFDTGSRYSVIATRRLTTEEGYEVGTLHFVGSETIAENPIVELDRLEVGGFWAEDVLISVSFDTGFKSVIGMDVLSHATLSVCWDSSQKRASLELQRNVLPLRLASTAEPTFGFTIGQNFDGRLFIVSAIDPSSAYESGVRPGSIVVGVRPSDELEFSTDASAMIQVLASSSTVQMKLLNPDSGSVYEATLTKRRTSLR